MVEGMTYPIVKLLWSFADKSHTVPVRRAACIITGNM